jgi:5-methylcytosine-specific restriction endonuclease McrA
MDRWLNKIPGRTNVEAVCPVCGVVFYTFPNRLTKYKSAPTCSNECRHKYHSIIIKQNHPRGMLGKKHKIETIEHLKNVRSLDEYKARIYTTERNKKISESNKGPLHYRWSGGPKTPKAIKDKIRKSLEYRQWRKAVFERDNWTCRRCGDRNGRGHEVYLEAHHIKSFADFPELRYDINNGETLCSVCHNKETALAMKGNQNGKMVG